MGRGRVAGRRGRQLHRRAGMQGGAAQQRRRASVGCHQTRQRTRLRWLTASLRWPSSVSMALRQLSSWPITDGPAVAAAACTSAGSGSGSGVGAAASSSVGCRETASPRHPSPNPSRSVCHAALKGSGHMRLEHAQPLAATSGRQPPADLQALQQLGIRRVARIGALVLHGRSRFLTETPTLITFGREHATALAGASCSPRPAPHRPGTAAGSPRPRRRQTPWAHAAYTPVHAF